MGVMENTSYTFTKAPSVAEEVSKLYDEASNWVEISNPEPRDTSEDWKIKPLYVIDPALHRQWNTDRTWLLDPMDAMIGDDAMPAHCIECNGVYWGEDMISVRSTINKLRQKHSATLKGIGSIWDESEDSIIEKLRNNRFCKKCFNTAKHTREADSAWQQSPYTSNVPQLDFDSSNDLTLQSKTVVVSSGICMDDWVTNYTL